MLQDLEYYKQTNEKKCLKIIFVNPILFKSQRTR